MNSVKNPRFALSPGFPFRTVLVRAGHACLRLLIFGATFTHFPTPLQATPPSWTAVKKPAPGHAGTMLLLTDGTVMVQGPRNTWMRLTPDSSGSYIDGAWSTIAPMSIPRLYYASQVLPNGKVWVEGGEYSGTGLVKNDSATGEIYDPIDNRWSRSATFPNQPNCTSLYEFGGAIAKGSPVVKGLLSTAFLRSGWYVLGPGIPEYPQVPHDTRILSIDSISQIHLNANATLTGTTQMRFAALAYGNTTAKSSHITGIQSTAGFQPGWYVFGTNIPFDAQITAVNSPHEITISSPATGSAQDVKLSIEVVVKPKACMGDDVSILLSGGRILAGDIFSNTTYSYDIATNLWSLAAYKVYGSSGEQTYVKLQDGSVLTYDIIKSIVANEGYAEIYNPTTNLWSSASPGDGTAHGTLPLLTIRNIEEIGPALRLLDGRIFLIGGNGFTALYNPATNTWSAGPSVRARLGPSPIFYVADDAPAAILPSGHVIFASDAGLGIASTGTIEVGSPVVSDIPLPAADQVQKGWVVSGSGIPNGTTIKSVSAAARSVTLTANVTATATDEAISFGGPYSNPTVLFDFDPSTDKVAPLSPASPDPTLPYFSAYVYRMLMLPTGQLLMDDSTNQLWICTSSGAAPSRYLPKVTAVAHVSGDEYKLTGTQISGQSAGASYGDDAQMDENYPIIRLVSSTQKVYYARTTHWSSTDVGTGSAPQTVDFAISHDTPPGAYSLILSAAGLQSAPFTFHLQ